MIRNVTLSVLALSAFCGVAFAESQTVSYFSGACPGGSGNCVVVASLPPQGFVLTDILYAGTVNAGLQVKEGSTIKGQFILGELVGPVFSYHLSSGIPFAGGSPFEIQFGGSESGNALTFVGYIPGTQAQSVPAMGNIALSILALLIFGAGGYILRKRSPIRWNAAT